MLTKAVIDYDAINKGDVIPAEALEELFGCDRESKEFAFQQMSLAGELSRELNARGKGVTVCSSGSQIRILSDNEALEYNSKAFRSGLSKMRKSHDRLMLIDRGNLSVEEQKTHEREVLIQGKTIQAAMSAYKGLTAPAHHRSTPGLAG